MTYDEDQYVAAAVMAWSHLPYADFAYLQPPLYPLALAPVMALASGWYVLAARTVSFVLALGSGMLLWHLVRRLGAGPMLAMVLLTACLSSPFLIAPLANARNDGLPLLLLLAGCRCMSGRRRGATRMHAPPRPRCCGRLGSRRRCCSASLPKRSSAICSRLRRWACMPCSRHAVAWFRPAWGRRRDLAGGLLPGGGA